MSTKPSDGGGKRVDWLIGLSIYGGAITGVAALALALFSFFNGQWPTAATSLIAAAIAFGALANAVLRD